MTNANIAALDACAEGNPAVQLFPSQNNEKLSGSILIGNSVPSQVRKGLSLSTPHLMYPVRIVEITIRINSVMPILLVRRIISNTILKGSITNTLPDSVISQIPRSTIEFPDESWTNFMKFFSDSKVVSDNAIIVHTRNAASNRKNGLERMPNNIFCNLVSKLIIISLILYELPKSKNNNTN